MIIKSVKRILVVWVLVLKVCKSLNWKAIRCAADDIDSVPNNGFVPDSRFPWLGVVQHSFYLAEKMQFAITSGVLIHPGYVMAPADDMAKIPPKQLENKTDFIVWGKAGEKYAVSVYTYILHPDFINQVTSATIALLQLMDWADGRRPAPVDPICLPLKGMGSFDNLFVVKMDDRIGKLQKEILKVDYVEKRECSEFYFKAQLTLHKMIPQYALCSAVSPPDGEDSVAPCIWDSGALLVARLNNAYWTLLGFGVRGPGCGAPARFVGINRMVEWISDTIRTRPLEDLPEDHAAVFLRQLSPLKLTLYKADVAIPQNYGMCERTGGEQSRGSVVYRDNAEIITNKNYGQGFYFLSVHTVMMFTCGTIRLDSTMKSIMSIWVEHSCMPEEMGQAVGMTKGPSRKRFECFHYFKTTGFVEFRFIFSFKAFILATLYGRKLMEARTSPWHKHQITDAWTPTNKVIQWDKFIPYYWSFWL